jgi:hypothetical protein
MAGNTNDRNITIGTEITGRGTDGAIVTGAFAAVKIQKLGGVETDHVIVCDGRGDEHVIDRKRGPVIRVAK